MEYKLGLFICFFESANALSECITDQYQSNLNGIQLSVKFNTLCAKHGANH